MSLSLHYLVLVFVSLSITRLPDTAHEGISCAPAFLLQIDYSVTNISCPSVCHQQLPAL